MKRPHETPPLAVEEEIDSSITDGFAYRSVKLSKGAIRFSEFYGLPVTAERRARAIREAKAKGTFERRVALRYESFSELRDDHGDSVMYPLLANAPHPLGWHPDVRSLIFDIKTKVGSTEWRDIRKRMKREGGKVLLIALWAELFEETLSDIWLAAMALHAQVNGNDFAFGYLIAQLDQRGEFETNFLRGKKSVENAKAGGVAKSKALAPTTQRTLAEMKRLRESNPSLSVRRVGELAYQRKFGSSAMANAKLLSRHKK